MFLAFFQALTSAMKEEESLGNQLEKENEEALQQANVEEQNYLQEIAREESMEIEVETEPETEAESDLGVQHMLRYKLTF